MASIGLRLALAAAAIVLATSQGTGKVRHRQPAQPATSTATTSAPTAPHSFYPNEVEGGVSGNLPFNNQIRKHTDPLNANGGK